MRPPAVLLSMALTVGCGIPAAITDSLSGSSSRDCKAIARDYAAAMPDARLCDPNATDQCVAGFDGVSYSVPDGGTIDLNNPNPDWIGGLAAPCPCANSGARLNPSRTAVITALRTEYQSAGCVAMSNMPGCCPPHPDGNGGWTTGYPAPVCSSESGAVPTCN